jgi:S-DNA-T family DNA segregation ATPase FtsK/SpoIIIE
MTDLKILEKKINELENRIEKLENDNDWMDDLYHKAEELVVKNEKASAIFLQRKLMIDLERAARIIDKLETNGIVGPASGAEPRKILIKKK